VKSPSGSPSTLADHLQPIAEHLQPTAKRIRRRAEDVRRLAERLQARRGALPSPMSKAREERRARNAAAFLGRSAIR
jgi:hypothetical protein